MTERKKRRTHASHLGQPRPFPAVDAFAPLDDIVATRTFGAFVQTFAQRIEGSRTEVMWTALDDGTVVESVGVADSVAPTFPMGRLVLAEIHNHLAPEDQRAAFIHLSDIAASFSSGTRVFGTYLALVQAPNAPYAAGCRFNAASIARLREADRQPHDDLFATIKGIHGSKRRGRAFLEDVLSSGTLAELLKLYQTTLPMLDFVIIPSDKMPAEPGHKGASAIGYGLQNAAEASRSGR